jgi:hypothetical protein
MATGNAGPEEGKAAHRVIERIEVLNRSELIETGH